MKLYEITEQYRELLKLADESEDMAEAVKNTMEAIEGDFNDKAISLIHVVNNIGSDVIAIDTEMKRLSERIKVMKNRQDSMRDYLRINMEASEISKITCPLFTITLAKGRDMVQIQDADKIPTDYLNIKTTVTPMKKEILATLKSGGEISGAIMIKSKSSLRIK